MLSATALMVGTAVLATPAAATCFVCTANGSGYDFSVGGEAVNKGSGFGNIIAGAKTVTTKDIRGGGDSQTNTGSGSDAQSYAAADFTTKGLAFGKSLDSGLAQVSSQEYGVINGSGMAQVDKDWGNFKVTRKSSFGFAAGGKAFNDGVAEGDIAWADTKTTKKLAAGGYGKANTNRGNGAGAYSNVQMATNGQAGALSFGPGNKFVKSSEVGSLSGGGGTIADTSIDLTYNGS